VKPLTGRAFARLIEGRGWIRLRVNGSHHIYGREGDAARLSVPIHGNKLLKAGLQRHLAKLAGLTDADMG
jgi:predicted RNA binding protein YcfA (HicA-like mRNA interferase family)